MEPRELLGVWRWTEDPDHVVVYTANQTWSFNIGDVRYTDEPYSVTTWFLDDGELVKHQQPFAADGTPGPHVLERRFAIELDGDELRVTDLDFDSIRVFRRECDPARIAELSRPIAPVEPAERDEPGLGVLRWYARHRFWRGETELAGVRLDLHLAASDDADPRPFEVARAALANLDLDRCLDFASVALLDLANDWRPDGTPPLDVAALRARMVPGGLSTDGSSGASLGVEVGDVFGDHGIEVTLDAASEPVRARMY